MSVVEIPLKLWSSAICNETKGVKDYHHWKMLKLSQNIEIIDWSWFLNLLTKTALLESKRHLRFNHVWFGYRNEILSHVKQNVLQCFTLLFWVPDRNTTLHVIIQLEKIGMSSPASECLRLGSSGKVEFLQLLPSLLKHESTTYWLGSDG